ncbi:MAG TPA: hypothetical protein IAC60_00820 [Candidatus Enterosoma merdigallinarum]|nr:hypothetical protein [Candidatus Enterosoma merdigallinarum]
MKRLFRRLGLFFLSFLFLFPLTSCGSFFEDGGMQIADIVTKTDEEGNTTITISFTDDYYDPVEFTIPAPEDGQEGPQGPVGNGIEKIEKVKDPETEKTYLVITFTDETMEPARIELADAVGIEEILTSFDNETGTTTITITLTDGTTKEFVLQNGKDGVGIADIESTTDEEGNTTITITYTDESKDPTVITIPYIKGNDGEDGRGIASITTQCANGIYYLFITYTDSKGPEDVQTIELPMPESTQWFRGNGAPGPSVSLQASSGDFYFDLTNLTIYLFNGVVWQSIANLRSETIPCTIEFDATTNGGLLDDDYLSTVTCYKGESLDISQIPTASKEGAAFIGWYTSAQGPRDPRAGKFTDLTPVTKVYTHLFACFEEE